MNEREILVEKICGLKSLAEIEGWMKGIEWVDRPITALEFDLLERRIEAFSGVGQRSMEAKQIRSRLKAHMARHEGDVDGSGASDGT